MWLKDNIRREINNIPQETFPQSDEEYGSSHAISYLLLKDMLNMLYKRHVLIAAKPED